MPSVFEHVAEEFLHGSVPDGPVEEQQLYPLRVDKTQRGEEEKQLSKPADAEQDRSATRKPKVALVQPRVASLPCYLAGWLG